MQGAPLPNANALITAQRHRRSMQMQCLHLLEGTTLPRSENILHTHTNVLVHEVIAIGHEVFVNDKSYSNA